MAVPDAQDIFRSDGNCAAQSERPRCRRTEQNADADAGDVGAGEVRPGSVDDFTERDFGKDTNGDCQRGFLVAFKDPERQVPNY